MRNRPFRLSAALVLPAALVLTACSSAPAVGSTTVAVTAGDGTCEVARTSVPAGVVTFSVANTGAGATELYVYDETGTTILSEVENVGPGVTRALVVELAEGTAVVGCRSDGASDLIRTDVTVTASGATAAAATSPTLAAAVEKYRAYVAAESDALLDRTGEFVAAVNAGDVATAKALYPEARRHWERIEPVAEVFADLDPPSMPARTMSSRAPTGPGGTASRGRCGWTAPPRAWARSRPSCWPTRPRSSASSRPSSRAVQPRQRRRCAARGGRGGQGHRRGGALLPHRPLGLPGERRGRVRGLLGAAAGAVREGRRPRHHAHDAVRRPLRRASRPTPRARASSATTLSPRRRSACWPTRSTLSPSRCRA